MADDNELAARDRGLSSLGLLMQLGGSVFAAATILYMFISLVGLRGNGADMLATLLILALCGMRSMFLRQAGSDLLYSGRALADAPHDWLAGVRRYITIALAQTAVIAMLLVAKWHAEPKVVFGVAAGLALWPVVLAIVITRPSFKQFRTEMPPTEDKGFEGASILMATLGGVGVCVGLVTLVASFKMLAQGPGVVMVLALIMLVIRSFLHLHAGLAGLRETSVERSADLAQSYARFGVISSFGAGGAMLVVSFATAFSVFTVAMLCALVWVLLSWPLIIRRFFTDRQFTELVAGDGAMPHRRARDGGLSGLGWLLVAASAMSMSLLLPGLIAGEPISLTAMFVMGSGTASVWWSLGFIALQAWAGGALITMGRQHRVIGLVYAIAGSAVQIYLMWPVIDLLWHHDGDSTAMAPLIGGVAYALALPIATLILVNRRLAPTAFARFRIRKP